MSLKNIQRKPIFKFDYDDSIQNQSLNTIKNKFITQYNKPDIS